MKKGNYFCLDKDIQIILSSIFMIWGRTRGSLTKSLLRLFFLLFLRTKPFGIDIFRGNIHTHDYIEYDFYR